MSLSSNFLDRKKERQSLRKYYSNYYNGNYLRDYRFIFDDKTIHKYNDVLTHKKYLTSEEAKKKALNFLVSPNHMGKKGVLLNEITYYKSLDDYKKGNNQERYSDRFFFDFDIEDDRVDDIKSGMKDAYKNLKGSAKRERIEDLRSDFRDLIFNEDLILPTFKEASSLCEYLEGLGLKPYLIFSGSKGFHVNVFFDEKKLLNISQISYSLAKSYKDKLDLNYLDLSVNKDAKKRSQRVQYSYHSKTNLLTIPIDRESSYDDVLSIIEKNKRSPIPFQISDYKSPDEFNDMLVRLDNDIGLKLKKRQKDLENLNLQRKKALKRKYKGNVQSFSDIDMRELANAYGIDGISKGDRIIVKCPFHNDSNPSAVVFRERFHCSTCNLTLNYYDFISKMENTNDKKAIMQKLNDIVR